MGVLRLGVLIRFIPVAVIIGFTNGIAVLIFLSQMKDFSVCIFTLCRQTSSTCWRPWLNMPSP